MLLATTSRTHFYILLRSCASFRGCQRFLVTAHHSISSSAMLRNLSTINMETPWARGSTYTGTKQTPAYASGGHTFAPRLVQSTRTIHNSKPLRKHIRAQAMCAHGRPRKHKKKRLINNQVMHASLAHCCSEHVHMCATYTRTQYWLLETQAPPSELSVWTRNRIQVIGQPVRHMTNDEVVIN